jgi:hypothetical protein
MIPQDVLEIVHVAQVREHASHNIDNGICTPFPLFPVLKHDTVIDHILDISPVFGHDQFFLLRVVYHNRYAILFYFCFLSFQFPLP